MKRARAEDSSNPKQTLASSVYATLRADILTGAIRPGAKVNIRDVSQQFSVGLSPVREALSRLSAEGLLRQSDNRGFAVTPVSVVELEDLTNARCWVNEVSLRQAIAHAPPEWEERVLIALHRLTRTPRELENRPERRNPAWEEAHRVFHRSLVAGCGSSWMTDICERLFEASERYRHLARLAGVFRGDSEAEHRAIAEAAMERDADTAVELLNAHFRRTADLVREVVASR